MGLLRAIDMIQESSIRLGIIRPDSINSLSGTAASRMDKDAMLLLGALNQTARNTAVVYPFPDFMRTLSYDIINVDPEEGTVDINYDLLVGGYKIERLCPGFDGIITNDFYFPRNTVVQRPSRVGLITFEEFIRIRESSQGEFPIDIPGIRPNGYLLQGQFICFAKPLPVGAKMVYTYKTKLPVLKAILSSPQLPPIGYEPAMTFTNDEDMCVVDDELLILGCTMFYKNYRGMNFQLEQQLYVDYINHLKESRGGIAVIKENYYREYLPQEGAPRPQQQQQPQRPQQGG
jgi:hypothetical protein